ncbi:MAG: hypothetical protein DRJ07_14960 [Bacteroidetes bacterium]|nr:MAG: hypothetical protein DRJ07_14960 [Bacteroidota bacterium]
MKNKKIYLLGIAVFIAVLSINLQFGSNDSNSFNDLSIMNIEALAGGTQLCSYSCYPLNNDCCMSCDFCDVIENFNEADVKASRCMQIE